eukprot:1050887-Pyramimonas_sp.AAC.1
MQTSERPPGRLLTTELRIAHILFHEISLESAGYPSSLNDQHSACTFRSLCSASTLPGVTSSE